MSELCCKDNLSASGKTGDDEHYSNTSNIKQIFLEFQMELDSRYDKHERLVKLSRDTTAQSKKVIFLLHRNFDDKATNETKSDIENDSILVQAKRKLSEIQRNLLHRILIEIQNEADPLQYHRAYTSGIQEYIEALLFWEFLKSSKLLNFTETREWLSFGELQDDLSKECTEYFPLEISDYVLGVADMTGEIMRLAVNVIGKGNTSLPFDLLAFLRNVQTCFSSLTTSVSCSSVIQNKLQTLNECVTKVERVCYNIKLREIEKLTKI